MIMPLTNETRASWDSYFMQIAHKVKERSTCPRAQVGAIVVLDNRILGSGYNGAPAKMPHCTDVGCLMWRDHCIRVVHAEANAVLQASIITDPYGATLYCTHMPCLECCKLLINAGITRVVYEHEYYDNKCDVFGVDCQRNYLFQAGVIVEQWKDGKTIRK